MSRKNVDNAQNRRLGRVGMPVGSMVESRGSSGSSSNCVGSSDTVSYQPSRSSSAGCYSSSSSQKTNADNVYNGCMGPAGDHMGSMPVSEENSFSNSSAKTYVDNESNMKPDRVGKVHDTAVVSKSDTSTDVNASAVSEFSETGTRAKVCKDNSMNENLGCAGVPVRSRPVSKGRSSSNSSTKTHVDNEYNRKHDVVRNPHGIAVISKSDKSADLNASAVSDVSETGTKAKVYKNNSMNRSLGRVGKPVGTCVVSKTGKTGVISQQYYVNSALNRQLDRVGKPRGSMPHSKVSKKTNDVQKIMDQFENNPDIDFDPGDSGFGDESMGQAVALLNRRWEEMAWMEENEMSKVETSESILADYTGKRIAFEDIEFGRKIGQGGFGDVYFAKWYGSVVAVKKLRVQNVSKKRLKDFSTEVMAFCNLEHPNIVKFIGACLTVPNLCIAMEYMQTSLFEALHISQDIDLNENERIDVIKQTCGGLVYLHAKGIAHCDLKSPNILLDYEAGISCKAKITDFGLSMIKSNAETSVTTGAQVCNVGTPRYSAPEVLRGEMLSAKAMMKADIYSLALVIYEIIYEEEPFYNLNYAQLLKQVGEKGIVPNIPEESAVSTKVESFLKQCWDFKPENRPGMDDVDSTFNAQSELYLKE